LTSPPALRQSERRFLIGSQKWELREERILRSPSSKRIRRKRRNRGSEKGEALLKTQFPLPYQREGDKGDGYLIIKIKMGNTELIHCTRRRNRGRR